MGSQSRDWPSTNLGGFFRSILTTAFYVSHTSTRRCRRKNFALSRCGSYSRRIPHRRSSVTFHDLLKEEPTVAILQCITSVNLLMPSKKHARQSSVRPSSLCAWYFPTLALTLHDIPSPPSPPWPYQSEPPTTTTNVITQRLLLISELVDENSKRAIVSIRVHVDATGALSGGRRGETDLLVWRNAEVLKRSSRGTS